MDLYSIIAEFREPLEAIPYVFQVLPQVLEMIPLNQIRIGGIRLKSWLLRSFNDALHRNDFSDVLSTFVNVSKYLPGSIRQLIITMMLKHLRNRRFKDEDRIRSLNNLDYNTLGRQYVDRTEFNDLQDTLKRIESDALSKFIKNHYDNYEYWQEVIDAIDRFIRLNGMTLDRSQFQILTADVSLEDLSEYLDYFVELYRRGFIGNREFYRVLEEAIQYFNSEVDNINLINRILDLGIDLEGFDILNIIESFMIPWDELLNLFIKKGGYRITQSDVERVREAGYDDIANILQKTIKKSGSRSLRK